ncbi:MAG: HD domain-containing phosphohydrolase [archaeon]
MPLRINRNQLRGIIATERKIARARHRRYLIEGRRKKGKNTTNLEKKREKDLKSLTDAEVLGYVKGPAYETRPTTFRGDLFLWKRRARLALIDLMGRILPDKYDKTLVRLAFRAKDLGTVRHAEDVVPIAMAIFKNLTREQRKKLEISEEGMRLATAFHDIGKLDVPTHILRKTEYLTEKEWERVKKHPEKGEEIMKDWGASEEIATAVRQHHQYDSERGYPKKTNLVKEPAKLIMLADGIERMSTGKHGNEPMTLSQIEAEITKQPDQFHEPYVSAFFKALEEDQEFRKWWEKRIRKMGKHLPWERKAPQRYREGGGRIVDENR